MKSFVRLNLTLLVVIAGMTAFCTRASAAVTTLDSLELIGLATPLNYYKTELENTVTISSTSSWVSARWWAKNTATNQTIWGVKSVPDDLRRGGTWDFIVNLPHNANYDCWITDSGNKQGPPGQDWWVQDTNHLEIEVPLDTRPA